MNYPEAKLIPANYGEEPPWEYIDGQDIMILDFSWKREKTLEIRNRANTVLIIEHHITAQKELSGLEYVIFDNGHSGAYLTWKYLNSHLEVPWYVLYVEDRDLWRWQLPNSKAINAYLMAMPQTVQAWEELNEVKIDIIESKGEAILLHIAHYIDKTANQARACVVADQRWYIVNATYLNISDVCNELCNRGADVGCGWFERKDGLVQFSLRSRNDCDVSIIAKNYGGGGHKHAAGFELTKEKARTLLDKILANEFEDIT